ncbi:MAG: OadG family protein [Blautia sp.]|nr:OadG family protein [Blautia sp.]
MKKWLLVLGIITCMAGLTACGQQEQQEMPNMLSEQEATKLASDWANDISQVVARQMEGDFIALAEQNGWDTAVFEGAFESWKSASEDMGNYEEVIEVTENSMVGEMHNDTNYPVEGTIVFRVKGSKHNATVELVYENYMPVTISTNVEYTFAENMQKAALNTVLGMGTVFVILILISLIISAFGLIPKLVKPKKQPEEEKKSAPVAVQAPVEEDLSDDLELAAVIAAAVAAYEGSGSTDGFVVRSIRKANR